MASVAAQHPHGLHTDSGSDSEVGMVCCPGLEGDDYSKQPVSSVPQYVRNGFIRKVYGILSVQLLLTCAIAIPFNLLLTPAFVATHMGLYYAALFGTLATVLGMACCCGTAARTFPTNYILLFVLTVFQAILVGFIVTLYTGSSVLIAMVTTGVIFTVLSVYAWKTGTDFTGMGAYLAAGLSALCCFSFVMWMFSMFMPIPHGVKLIYSFLGVILFSFYIVYDTQLIIGGKHEQEFSVDDYCFAALNLYLDIINMFLNILQLLGDRR